VTLVRIAGLMRSGSNLLTWVLRQNFAEVATATMLLGWKHGPIYRDRPALGVDEYVDPRYRDSIRAFVRDRADEWARVTASPLFAAAADAQRNQGFAVALAVRDPALWYASCVRIGREWPGFLLHDVAPAAAAAFWNQCHREWLATLGERSVVVDTDRLRHDPEPELDRIAVALRLQRLPHARLPEGYLHPRGTEEIYELLGAPIVPEMEREFTTLGAVDADQRAEFLALLDQELLTALGLGS
jgi:hypothetical protein